MLERLTRVWWRRESCSIVRDRDRSRNDARSARRATIAAPSVHVESRRARRCGRPRAHRKLSQAGVCHVLGRDFRFAGAVRARQRVERSGARAARPAANAAALQAVRDDAAQAGAGQATGAVLQSVVAERRARQGARAVRRAVCAHGGGRRRVARAAPVDGGLLSAVPARGQQREAARARAVRAASAETEQRRGQLRRKFARRLQHCAHRALTAATTAAGAARRSCRPA